MGTHIRAKAARSKSGRPGAAKSKSKSATASPFLKTTFSRHTSLWQIIVPPHGSASSSLHFAGMTGSRDEASWNDLIRCGDRGECVVSLHPGRERRDRNVPFDEAQPFPSVGLDLHWQRSSFESSRPESTQEGMHGLGVGVRGSKDEVTFSDDTSGVCDSSWQDLVHGTSLSRTAPVRRAGVTLRHPVRSFRHGRETPPRPLGY